MYHTQEKRGSNILEAPIMCTRFDAWLGEGYYFWDNEIDAIHWGNNSKNRTGRFQIYKAFISEEDILNTVFNEEHYKFWIAQIEKIAKAIIKKTGSKASLKEVNQYMKERAGWNKNISGIMFQDLPNSEDLLVMGLFYRKRIQLVAYKLEIIKEFSLKEERMCND